MDESTYTLNIFSNYLCPKAKFIKTTHNLLEIYPNDLTLQSCIECIIRPGNKSDKEWEQLLGKHKMILGLWQIYNGKSRTIRWPWYPVIHTLFELGTKHVNIVEVGREKIFPQNLIEEGD